MTAGEKRADGICKSWGCTNMVPPLKNGKKSQRHYCASECRIANDIRCGMGIRWQVKKRDAGVCARCGLDTERLEHALTHADRSINLDRLDRIEKCQDLGVPFDEGRPMYPTDQWKLPKLVSSEVWELLGFKGYTFDPKWEADHIVPVIERPASEPPCGLDGFRTLCVPCHRFVTAELRQRMAKRQRCHVCGRRKKKATKLTRRSCLCAEAE